LQGAQESIRWSDRSWAAAEIHGRSPMNRDGHITLGNGYKLWYRIAGGGPGS
jgi:hypothetical protein